ATVTASLMLTVSVTTWPAFKIGRASCRERVDVVTELTVGDVVSICSVPAGLVTAPERSALLPAASCSVAPFRLKDVTARSLVSCPAPTVRSEERRVGKE